MPSERRFLVSCLHCHRLVMLVGRIGGAERTQLVAHLLVCRPETVVGPSPGVEATLRQFRVEPEREPPDALCAPATTL
jgi:hypothetical protein